MRRVQRADPTARRNALIAVLILGLAGSVASLLFRHYEASVLDWLIRSAGRPTSWCLAVAALLLPMLVMPVYLLRLGAGAVKAGRFPPPGYRLIRDTPVWEGAAGVRLGRVLQLMAVLLFAAVAVLAVISCRLLPLLAGVR